MAARRPGSGRRPARAGALTALAVLTGLAGCSASQPADVRPALTLHGDVFSECESGLSASDWATKRNEVVEFGLGYVRLRAGADEATFTGARLHDVAGALHLVHAALVPGGGFGEGFPWGARRPIQFPAAWRARSEPPRGVLRAVEPGAVSGFPDGWDGRTWQLVVGVRAGHGDGGVARGVTLAYSVGGRTFRLVQRDAVGVTRTGAECDRLLDQPSGSSSPSRQTGAASSSGAVRSVSAGVQSGGPNT